MLDVFGNRTERHRFFAQVIALLGTGLATVALSLLAFDLAGANAGAVLGTALAIKMVAYIDVAPVAAAFAERLPQRAAPHEVERPKWAAVTTRVLAARAAPDVFALWAFMVQAHLAHRSRGVL